MKRHSITASAAFAIAALTTITCATGSSADTGATSGTDAESSAIGAPAVKGGEALAADQDALNKAPDDMSKVAYLTTSRRIAIPVASSAERAAVTRAGLLPVTFAHGYTSIVALHTSLSPSVLAVGGSVGIVPSRAKVVVTVPSRAAGSGVARAAAGNSAVAFRVDDAKVETLVGRGQPPKKSIPAGTARAGVSMIAGWTLFYDLRSGDKYCTSGFNARKGGQKVMLTAGRCTINFPDYTIRRPVHAGGPGAATIGITGSSWFKNGGYDQGLNFIYSAVSAPGWVAIRAGSGGHRVINRTVPKPYMYESLCQEGITSGHQCGNIIALEADATFVENGYRVIIHGLALSTALTAGGDVGGPVITTMRATTANGLGIIAGSYGGFTLFTPLYKVVRDYGVTMS